MSAIRIVQASWGPGRAAMVGDVVLAVSTHTFGQAWVHASMRGRRARRPVPADRSLDDVLLEVAQRELEWVKQQVALWAGVSDSLGGEA